MKTIWAVFLIVSSSAFADTNFFPLLECHNRTYTNATLSSITPATVTVFWDGGGEKIAITNLPDAIQKQYNYDPTAADKYLADIAAKKAGRNALAAKNLAEQQKAQSTLGPSKRIQIVKPIAASIYQIIVDGAYQNAYIHNLPLEIGSFVDDYNNTLAHADSTKYVSGSETVVLRNGVRAQSQVASDAMTARRHLSDLAPSRRVLLDRTTVIASPSAYLIAAGVRQWEFQAVPSPSVPGSVTQ